MRWNWLRTVAVVLVVAWHTGAAGPGDKKAVRATQEWSGSVADEALMATAPTAVTSADDLAALWKAWGVAGDVPAVDFGKEVVVVTTTRGSRLRLAVTLDEKGNLEVGGLATRDLRPGFRYVIASVGRDGVATVNGAPLKKDDPKGDPKAGPKTKPAT